MTTAPRNAASGAVCLEGQKRLVRQLRKFDHEAGKAIKAANREIAESVAVTVRDKAPRRKGRLAKSVRAGASTFSAFVRVGGAAIPYAGPIIFGWRAHGIAANPFPFQALDERRKDIVAMHAVRINRVVEETLNGRGV